MLTRQSGDEPDVAARVLILTAVADALRRATRYDLEPGVIRVASTLPDGTTVHHGDLHQSLRLAVEAGPPAPGGPPVDSTALALAAAVMAGDLAAAKALADLVRE